ncbi:MAG TPA: cupin domain-containing protein [Ignavibacteria bacterium]|nr:cupin domain-containing protein [Ignavibacteria bacterium]
MKESYTVQKSPFVAPTTDKKLIEEFFGMASIRPGDSDMSFAHMIAPPGWSEPFQTPEFDEVTYIISGKKKFEAAGESIVLEKNQAICVNKGTRVRYSNPFDEPVEYISVCMPAFSAAKVHRET